MVKVKTFSFCSSSLKKIVYTRQTFMRESNNKKVQKDSQDLLANVLVLNVTLNLSALVQ